MLSYISFCIYLRTPSVCPNEIDWWPPADAQSLQHSYYEARREGPCIWPHPRQAVRSPYFRWLETSCHLESYPRMPIADYHYFDQSPEGLRRAQAAMEAAHNLGVAHNPDEDLPEGFGQPPLPRNPPPDDLDDLDQQNDHNGNDQEPNRE